MGRVVELAAGGVLASRGARGLKAPERSEIEE